MVNVAKLRIPITAVVCLFAVTLLTGLTPETKHGSRDDQTRAILRKLHNAIRLYQGEYGVKEPGLRSRPSDAGLPPTILTLTQPGHPWSIDGGLAGLTVKSHPVKPEGPSVGQLYPTPDDQDNSELRSLYAGYAEIMKRMGDRLPISFDPFYDLDPVKMAPKNVIRETLILRLNGDIEVVQNREGEFIRVLYEKEN